MPRWPKYGPIVPPILSPWFAWPFDGELQLSTSANTSTAWSTANAALYFPIWLPEPCVVTVAWWQNGTTATGNIDCGIYTSDGKRILSTGSTAQSGTSAIQSVNITDTQLPEGLIYLALAASSGSATFWETAAGPNGYTSGIKLQLSAFPLPNPATFATINGAALPKFGFLVAPRTVL